MLGEGLPRACQPFSDKSPITAVIPLLAQSRLHDPSMAEDYRGPASAARHVRRVARSRSALAQSASHQLHPFGTERTQEQPLPPTSETSVLS